MMNCSKPPKAIIFSDVEGDGSICESVAKDLAKRYLASHMSGRAIISAAVSHLWGTMPHHPGNLDSPQEAFGGLSMRQASDRIEEACESILPGWILHRMAKMVDIHMKEGVSVFITGADGTSFDLARFEFRRVFISENRFAILDSPVGEPSAVLADVGELLDLQRRE